MARRAASLPDNEPIHDAWSEAWGDPALQNLGRRLVDYGLEEEQAARIVDQTWLFYSYVALPALQKRIPMGIATKQGENRPAIHFFLILSPRKDWAWQDVVAERFQALRPLFDELFATPHRDTVELHLELVTPDRPWSVNMNDEKPTEPERWLARYARLHHLDAVGVFFDNLAAELRTIMMPEYVPLWLETPNSLFLGNKPADFLDDPLDRLMRGVITRAKFNLPTT